MEFIVNDFLSFTNSLRISKQPCKIRKMKHDLLLYYFIIYYKNIISFYDYKLFF